MMQFAERLLRKHPQHITLLAPFTTRMLTFLCGTGHVVYTMFPIIADIALKRHSPGTADGGGLGGLTDGDHRLPVSVAVVSLVSILGAQHGIGHAWGSSKSSPFPYRPHCLASPLRHCGACAGAKTSQTILNFRKS